MSCIVYTQDSQVVHRDTANLQLALSRFGRSYNFVQLEHVLNGPHRSVVFASLRGRRKVVDSSDQPASQCFQGHHGNVSLLLLTC